MSGEFYSSDFTVMHLVRDVDKFIDANVSEELAASFKVVQLSSWRHIPEDWNVKSVLMRLVLMLPFSFVLTTFMSELLKWLNVVGNYQVRSYTKLQKFS